MLLTPSMSSGAIVESDEHSRSSAAAGRLSADARADAADKTAPLLIGHRSLVAEIAQLEAEIEILRRDRAAPPAPALPAPALPTAGSGRLIFADGAGAAAGADAGAAAAGGAAADVPSRAAAQVEGVSPSSSPALRGPALLDASSRQGSLPFYDMHRISERRSEEDRSRHSLTLDEPSEERSDRISEEDRSDRRSEDDWSLRERDEPPPAATPPAHPPAASAGAGALSLPLAAVTSDENAQLAPSSPSVEALLAARPTGSFADAARHAAEQRHSARHEAPSPSVDPAAAARVGLLRAATARLSVGGVAEAAPAPAAAARRVRLDTQIVPIDATIVEMIPPVPGVTIGNSVQLRVRAIASHEPSPLMSHRLS
jgi:hypothetical protein